LCKKYWIVDAVLKLSYDLGYLDEPFAREVIHATLLKSDDFQIIDDVLTFLRHDEHPIGEWIQLLRAFQLPLYYRLTRRHDIPAEPLLDQVGRFLDAMIVYRPSRTHGWMQSIAEPFCKDFAFLPLAHGRQLIMRIFKAMRDRKDFVATVRTIKTEEKVESERRWLEADLKPELVRAVDCKAPGCGLLLGRGKAITISGNVVLHEKCLEECNKAGTKQSKAESQSPLHPLGC
jgi:hypothetical protein